MPLTDPGTRSPGSVFLAYTAMGINHRVKVRYIHGTDIEAVSACRADATAFANVVKQVLHTGMTITAWGIDDPTGLELYQEPFAPTIAGTHTGSPNSVSHTVSIGGLGIPVGVGGAKGKTRVMLFEGNVQGAGAGIKTALASADPGWAAVSSWLTSNLRCFADFYGQHANPKSYVTFQYNGRAQRVHGS